MSTPAKINQALWRRPAKVANDHTRVNRPRTFVPPSPSQPVARERQLHSKFSLVLAIPSCGIILSFLLVHPAIRPQILDYSPQLLASMEQKQDFEGGYNLSGTQNVVPGTNFNYIKPQGREFHDPDVAFEEYHYYADKTRKEESTLESSHINWREFMRRRKENSEPTMHLALPGSNLVEADFATRERRLEISDEEWTNASRAFRTASWGSCELRDWDFDE